MVSDSTGTQAQPRRVGKGGVCDGVPGTERWDIPNLLNQGLPSDPTEGKLVST